MRCAVVVLTSACQELPRTYSTAASARPIFSDDFQRPELGPKWRVTGPGARVDGGALVVSGLRNHPLWLDVPLPDDVRIEFDATAATEQGDIKVEIAGDGASVATTTNYVASGYVVIFVQNLQFKPFNSRKYGLDMYPDMIAFLEDVVRTDTLVVYKDLSTSN